MHRLVQNQKTHGIMINQIANEFTLIMNYSAAPSTGRKPEITTRARETRATHAVIAPRSVINAIRPCINGKNKQPRLQTKASQDPRQPAPKKCQDNFLTKLHALLDDPKNSAAISWSENGRCFSIHDTDAFQKILPNYFRTSQMRSFRRQLNLYNLKKPETGQLTFFHNDFLRGDTFNFENVPRQRTKGQNKQKYQGPTLEEIKALPPAPTTSSCNDSQIEKDAADKNQSKRASKTAANDQGNLSSKKLKAIADWSDIDVTLDQGEFPVRNDYCYGINSPQKQRVSIYQRYDIEPDDLETDLNEALNTLSAGSDRIENSFTERDDQTKSMGSNEIETWESMGLESMGSGINGVRLD